MHELSGLVDHVCMRSLDLLGPKRQALTVWMIHDKLGTQFPVLLKERLHSFYSS